MIMLLFFVFFLGLLRKHDARKTESKDVDSRLACGAVGKQAIPDRKDSLTLMYAFRKGSV